MNKPLISLSILVMLQACSGKPAGFQGDTASMSANSTSGDATGRQGNRDAESDDATAASGQTEGIEQQIIETENVEMDAATIMEGLDATISVPGSAGSNTGSNASGSNASGSNSSANTSGSNASASNSSGSNSSGSSSSGSTSSAANNGSGNTASGTPVAVAPLTLLVTVPSTSLRSGSTAMQATAKLSNQTAADVTWTVRATGSNNAGSVDSNGLYTAPATGGGYDVTLTATLNDDPTITASVTIKIVVPEQIFVGCQQGSEFFPITADVYTLAANTNKLPDFTAIGAKTTTVCMDQYNVAPRDWAAGFPGVTGLFEWFALRTTTHLTIPADGTYAFKLNSDDGAKLYIDGHLVIDNDGQHAPTAKEASTYLTAGDHALTIDYFQGPRYQIALELYWKIPGAAAYVYVPKASFK